VDRQLRQPTERRVAGSEVVDRDSNTEPAQLVQRHHALLVSIHARLGDLEGQASRVETCPGQGVPELVDEAVIRELAGSEVDPDADVRSMRKGTAPLLGGGERLREDAAPEIDYQPALFGGVQEITRRQESALRMRPAD